MIDRIKSFFAKNVLESEETVASEQLATAALLVEVMESMATWMSRNWRLSARLSAIF